MKSFLYNLAMCLSLATVGRADGLEPGPGSISATASTKSLNNIVQLAAPLLVNELTYNRTIPLNIDKTGIMGSYEVNLTQLHFDNVEGPSINSVGWKNDAQDVLLIELSNLNVNITLDGKMKGLWVIDLSASHIYITNITLVLEASTSTTDQVHWALSENLQITVEDIEFKFNSRLVQKFANANHDKILTTVNAVLPKAQTVIAKKVDALNQVVANEGPMTFETSIVSDLIPINATLTKFLEFNEEEQLIELHMDGRVLDVLTQTTLVSPNMNWPERLSGSDAQMEQLFVHQNMLNSIILALAPRVMPISLTGDITDQLLQLFHEFKVTYGKDVKIELDVTLEDNGSETPLRLDADRGILIGSTDEDDVSMLFMFKASNDTVQSEPALELRMNLEVALNLTFENMELWARFEEINIANTEVTMDNVGMFYHDYDSLFTAVFESTAYNFNQRHKDGVDLTQKWPKLAFLNNLLRDLEITPLVTDEFVFAGFSWITDSLLVKE